MSWDLTIKPEDWLLAFWWVEIPAGCFDRLPDGGHRIALVRLLAPGAANHSPTWVMEDCVRYHGEQEWRRSQSFGVSSALCVGEAMEVRQSYYVDAGCTGGGLLIMGEADEARRIFAVTKRLPAWLRVQIIEKKAPEKPAAESGGQK